MAVRTLALQFSKHPLRKDELYLQLYQWHHVSEGAKVIRGFILAVVSGALCCAQPAPATKQVALPLPAPATKMEAFRPSVGSIITLGYDDPLVIDRVAVYLREARDSQGASVRGLLVQVREIGSQEDSFVDADEIPDLLKGFDAVLAVKENPTEFKYFEVRYQTRGDFEISAFNSGRSQGPEYGVKAGRVPAAKVLLSELDMQKLKVILANAYVKLKSLRAK